MVVAVVPITLRQNVRALAFLGLILRSKPRGLFIGGLKIPSAFGIRALPALEPQIRSALCIHRPRHHKGPGGEEAIFRIILGGVYYAPWRSGPIRGGGSGVS